MITMTRNKQPEAKEGGLTSTTAAMRKTILALQEYGYASFVKALVSAETGITDEDELTAMYLEFISDDAWDLLGDRFYSHGKKARNDGNDR